MDNFFLGVLDKVPEGQIFLETGRVVVARKWSLLSVVVAIEFVVAFVVELVVGFVVGFVG